MQNNAVIIVDVAIKASIEKVWKCWTTPANISQWNNPSSAWQKLLVEVDLRDRGRFLYRMQAKDGSEGFDYKGTYDLILPNERIELTTDDGRRTINIFKSIGS